MAHAQLLPRLAALTLVGALGTAASADLITDMPIVVPADNTQVLVEYISQTALYEGNLYFLGTGTADQVLNPAPNSDVTGLGQILFNNQGATAGDTTMLLGTFNAGDVIHLAYDIINPANVANELFRTDVAADQDYFDYDNVTGIIGIEDIRMPDSDLDYDDILFRIYFAQVPAPGVLALFGLTGLAAGRRRRR